MEWKKSNSKYFAWRLFNEDDEVVVWLRCIANLHWVYAVRGGTGWKDLGVMSDAEAKATALALYRMR